MTDRSRESLLLPIAIPLGALVVIVLVLFGFSRILLSLKPAAATATALVAAAGLMGAAAFVASRRRVGGGAIAGFVGATAGIAMLAGGIAIAVIGPPEPEIPPFPAEIAAPEGAIQNGFSTDELDVDVGKPIELTFDNEDPGVSHNIQIFDGPDASAPSLFDGQPVTGPGKQIYDVPPLQEGEYFFHCRLHPNTAMEGIVKVEPGAGGLRIVAKDLAFDTDRIQLDADRPTPLTFVNEDVAPHNLAIFKTEESTEALFRFEPVPGPNTQQFQIPPLPPGDYVFHCEVHPTMNGTVLVKGGGKGGGGPGEGGDGGGGG